MNKGPFTFSAIGWGTFDIPITIYWKDGSILTLEHELSF